QHGEGAAEEERGVAHDAAAHVGQRQLRERHWSPPTAPPITLRLSRICWKNAWRLEPRRNWLKARPSLMNTIRRQKLAENASCVTITTVTPSSWLRRCSALITSRAAFESRLPVSSSASTRAGSWIIALAIAARCC